MSRETRLQFVLRTCDLLALAGFLLWKLAACQSSSSGRDTCASSAHTPVREQPRPGDPITNPYSQTGLCRRFCASPGAPGASAALVRKFAGVGVSHRDISGVKPRRLWGCRSKHGDVSAFLTLFNLRFQHSQETMATYLKIVDSAIVFLEFTRLHAHMP